MRRLSLVPLMVALLLPLTLVLGIVGIGPLEMSDPPPVNRGGKVALVWSDRVFTSKEEFAAFLRSRGASYEQWAALHPGMAPWDPRPRLTPGARPASAKAPETVARTDSRPGRVRTTAARPPDPEPAADPGRSATERLTDLVDWIGRILLAGLAVRAAILGLRRLRRPGGLRSLARLPSLTPTVSLPKVRLPAVPPIGPRAAVARETAAVVAGATARAVARGSVVVAEATASAARRIRVEIDERELLVREIGFVVVSCLAVAAIGTFIALLLSGGY